MPFEEERAGARFNRGHDHADLRGHNREHLDGDTVELIQARPRSGLRQAAEHLRRHLVIDAVGAVEDDDVPRERLSEVLNRLRLAGTRGTQRVTAAAGEHRGSERHVAPIGERRHHEAPVVSLVLVPVGEHGEHLLDHAVVLLLIPVEPELRHPLKVGGRRAPSLGQLVDGISRMNLDCDQRDNLFPVHLVQLGPRERHELGQVAHPLLLQRAHGGFRGVGIGQGLLALGGPHHTSRGDYHLPRILSNPSLLLHALAVR